MKKDDNPFLGSEWQEMQRQYVEALSAFYPKQANNDTTYSNPQSWNKALDFWWKSIEGEISDKNKPVMDAILNQSRIFYSITEYFATMINEIGAADKDTDEWQGILNRNIDQMKTMFDQYISDNTCTASAPSFMWAQPAESWKDVMSGISLFPDEIMEKIMQQGVKEFSDKLLSMPGIGINSEYQDKLQTIISLWVVYQDNSNKYRQKFSELGKQAADKLRENILKKASKNEKITSLKEIYNMWIDANEEVFASYVTNEDYSKLYSELVNSFVKFKKQSNELSDDILKALNMPTSAGVNTITMRQHQIKNQLRSSMEMQQKTMDTLEKMRLEIQNIQSQISTKKSSKTKKISDGGKKKRVLNSKKKTNES
ncbi:MAG: class III poly(R)-hydroxyalkanoic acid synthase subunit PhaE [Gammaproteobacteria bacterium]|jgi:class III poly(R)-hydroxyalkanoic acid synthase PhaE subunit